MHHQGGLVPQGQAKNPWSFSLKFVEAESQHAGLEGGQLLFPG